MPIRVARVQSADVEQGALVGGEREREEGKSYACVRVCLCTVGVCVWEEEEGRKGGGGGGFNPPDTAVPVRLAKIQSDDIEQGALVAGEREREQGEVLCA